MRRRWAYSTISKLLLGFLCIGGMLITGCTNAKKETAAYPNKPIEMIVPYGPGGISDVCARIMEKAVKKHLPNGQSIVVVNKPGGASVVATTELFRAKPDGYKIAMVPPGPLSVQPHYGNTVYSHDSFQPIIKVATNPILLSVSADAPWKNFAEWLEYVKQNPDRFTFGGAGTGNPPHLALEKFLHAHGLKAKFVPFDGTGNTVSSLMGGHIQGAATAPEIKGQAESLRILANLGSSKNDFYKDVPILKELGYDVSTEVYMGIIAPKGMPPEMVNLLHEAFKKALEEPEVKESFAKMGLTISYAGPTEFQQEITRDYHEYGRVLKELGLAK